MSRSSLSLCAAQFRCWNQAAERTETGGIFLFYNFLESGRQARESMYRPTWSFSPHEEGESFL